MSPKKMKLSNDDPRFCEICNRWFPTGKAMGGHMRSHLAIAKLPLDHHRPTPPPIPPPPPPPAHRGQLRSPDPPPLTPSSSSNNSSTTLSIEPYSPTGGHPVTRRRSKRKRRQSTITISSARSDEEEVAMCLLMLSRDPQLVNFTWKNKKQNQDDPEASRRNGKAPMADYDDDDDENDDESCGRYRCETCQKGFRSYQALGGHRASHNKSSSSSKSLAADVDGGGEEEEEEEGDCDDDADEDDEDEDYLEEEEDQDLEQEQEVAAMNIGGGNIRHVSNADSGVPGGVGMTSSRRQFPCSFCGKVFDSGQALGGHKKIHMSYHHPPAPPAPAVVSLRTPTKASTEPVAPLLLPSSGGRLMIDLNSIPLEHDDDDDDDESDEVYQF